MIFERREFGIDKGEIEQMGQQYTLTVINNSTEPGDICVFQGVPDTNKADLTGAPKLVKYAEPGMTTTFEWDSPVSPQEPSPKYFMSFSPSTSGDVSNHVPQVMEVMFDETFSATKTLNQEHQSSHQYSLKVTNNSTMDGNFCLFQGLPDVNIPGVLALAWLSKRAHSGPDVTFTWTPDYNFVWYEKSQLTPGTKITASQTLTEVDLLDYNQVSFAYDGAYKFTDLTQGPRSDSLYIIQGADIPPQQAMVGIGMSGFATFVVPAQPNMMLYFTPHPKYYLVFGDYEQGDTIEFTETTQVVEISFADGFAVAKTLNRQNLWV
jgi:hypothetical protein